MKPKLCIDCKCQKARNYARAGMLGTLAHRAVLMPFAKAQTLLSGVLVGTNVSIPDSILESTDYLVRTMTMPKRQIVEAVNEVLAHTQDHPTRHLLASAVSREDPWSPLNVAMDAGGPWWNLGAAQYLGITARPYYEMEGKTVSVIHKVILSPRDRDLIRKRLPALAQRAAEALATHALRVEWEWMWSEVPLATWAGDRPDTTRIDLLVGSGGSSRGLAIDLKFRTGEPSVKTDDRDQLQNWRQGLLSMGFPSAMTADFGVLCIDTSVNPRPVALLMVPPRTENESNNR